jgi:CheY-like chemotaxis protein
VRILRSDARTRHIPVIALTGQAVDPAVRKEFEHVLLKPCMPDMLVLRVRSVVRHVGGRSRQS